MDRPTHEKIIVGDLHQQQAFPLPRSQLLLLQLKQPTRFVNLQHHEISFACAHYPHALAAERRKEAAARG